MESPDIFNWKNIKTDSRLGDISFSRCIIRFLQPAYFPSKAFISLGTTDKHVRVSRVGAEKKVHFQFSFIHVCKVQPTEPFPSVAIFNSGMHWSRTFRVRTKLLGLACTSNEISKMGNRETCSGPDSCSEHKYDVWNADMQFNLYTT